MGLITTLIRSGMNYASDEANRRQQQALRSRELDVQQGSINRSTVNTGISTAGKLVESAGKVYAGYLIGKSKRNDDDHKDSDNHKSYGEIQHARNKKLVDDLFPTLRDGLVKLNSVNRNITMYPTTSYINGLVSQAKTRLNTMPTYDTIRLAEEKNQKFLKSLSGSSALTSAGVMSLLLLGVKSAQGFI